MPQDLPDNGLEVVAATSLKLSHESLPHTWMVRDQLYRPGQL
ncbi:MAG TPA: hypothetical protein VMB05_11515 [Solirubrobacteraceae bacterium]|nr:hypothetical protein [Solirubrobacteraceae bacterium]